MLLLFHLNGKGIIIILIHMTITSIWWIYFTYNWYWYTNTYNVCNISYDFDCFLMFHQNFTGTSLRPQIPPIPMPQIKTLVPTCNSKRSKSSTTKEESNKKQIILKVASAISMATIGLLCMSMLFGSIHQGLNGSNGVDGYTTMEIVRVGGRMLTSWNESATSFATYYGTLSNNSYIFQATGFHASFENGGNNIKKKCGESRGNGKCKGTNDSRKNTYM